MATLLSLLGKIVPRALLFRLWRCQIIIIENIFLCGFLVCNLEIIQTTGRNLDNEYLRFIFLSVVHII